MTDIIDKANDLAERERDAAIARVMETTGKEVLTGFCQNDCGEATRGAFCSPECRHDYNMRLRMRG